MQTSFDPNNIDFKSIALKIWAYRYWFVLSVFVFLAHAFYKNKTTPFQYQNGCTIYVTDNNKLSFAGKSGILSSMNQGSLTENLENELTLLRSYTLINQALDQLDFEVSYFVENKPFNKFPLSKLPKKLPKEVYNDSPVKVVLDRSHNQVVGIKYYVEVLSHKECKVTFNTGGGAIYNYLDNEVVGYTSAESFSKIVKFNEEIKTENFKFVIQLSDTENPKKFNSNNFYFQLENMEYLTINYMYAIQLTQKSPTSSILSMSLTGSNKQKVTDFLNLLTAVYIEKDLSDKNRIAYNTIGFIDEQISDIADSLSGAESDLERFRSTNQIVDLDFQGHKVIDQIETLEAEKAMLMLQVRYYKYLRNYLKNNGDIADLVAPASMKVSDVNLNSIISELTTLNSEKISRIKQNPKDLHVKSIDQKINNIRQTLEEIVENNLKTVDISINEMEYRIKKMQGKLSKLPVTELKLLGIERNFKLNDAIYTYLLQKRAEAQIASASNTSSYQVVDPARVVLAKAVGAKSAMNYFIGIALGMVIPFVFILFKEFINNKINEASTLERLTNIPLLGYVYKSNRKIHASNLAQISDGVTKESIKSLRTNIQILGTQGTPNQVILTSSSVSNEGKTLIAINLALSFAMAKKKTVLVGYDLRNPSFDAQLKLLPDFGVSTYLAGVDSEADIIQNTSNEYLDVITEGPLSPNPLELIASGKSKDLIEYLRQNYEYIILDTSPIGLVTDAKLLMTYTDVNILVVRQSFTKLNDFVNNLKNLTNYKLANLWLVFNDYALKMDKNSSNYRYYSVGTHEKRKGLRYYTIGAIIRLFKKK